MARRAFKLDQMELVELAQLRDDVQSALSGKIEMERQELQSKLAEIEKLQDTSKSSRLTKPRVVAKGRKHRAEGKKAAPKYRGPNGETWAGRGLAPKWLVELEAKGKKRDQYLIKQ